MSTKKEKTVRTKATKTVLKSGLYNVTISMGGEVFNSETEDLVEAILSLHPLKIKSKVVITVEKDGKKAEKLMFALQARRVFNNKLAAEYFCKNLKLALH